MSCDPLPCGLRTKMLVYSPGENFTVSIVLTPVAQRPLPAKVG